VVKTVLNSQLRLNEVVRRLATKITLTVKRIYKFEQVNKLKNRRILEENV
jgi:hypothetical protein